MDEPKRLLVIDDEPEILRTVSMHLGHKYQVITAADAEEGYIIMRSTSIPVVICDQRLPNLTGLEFFSLIKKDHPDTIRILLTGYADIEIVIAAINEGNVFRYLTKPWDMVELESIINQAFEKYYLVINNRKLIEELKIANEYLEERVKERTQELMAANERLSELNKEKNRFLGIAAHDLRNPIATMLSFTELLIKFGNIYPEEKKKHFLELIHKACNFSLWLLNDLLDITKIEAGKLELTLRLSNYIEFLKNNLEDNKFFAEKKEIDIKFINQYNNITFYFDKNKMEQVLNNLISNAIKYSKPKTSISVTVEVDGEFVTTKVCDEGHGIPEKELPKLFKPFQTTSIKSKEEKSTGLGLAIVKKIVETHKGKIWVESEHGKGSIFYFKLPMLLSIQPDQTEDKKALCDSQK
ncbi:MAG: hybrid sensor histidine kinase/response regulator [Desulfobacterales bacterium]|nr:hybrid sensor histidine kinase/response regulator [Desulfobacterales bacterium]